MYNQKYVPIINPLAPKPSQLLAAALALFGPNGENWIQRKEKLTVRPWWGLGLVAHHAFCAIGAIHEVNTNNESLATAYLATAMPDAPTWGGRITSYNDNSNRTFPEIKAWFYSAIAAAQANGQ